MHGNNESLFEEQFVLKNIQTQKIYLMKLLQAVSFYLSRCLRKPITYSHNYKSGESRRIKKLSVSTPNKKNGNKNL